MKKIEFYLDCSSPWTYLSFRGILDLRNRKNFEIIWKPILVGGIFNSTNPSVYESRKNPIKEKLEYSQKDMSDWAELRKIKFNWPKIFPINSVKSMRGTFFFIDKQIKIEDYLEAVVKAYWTDGKDISNEGCLSSIVASLSESPEDFLEFIEKPKTKSRLIDNTQELMDRNGFGSPTFVLDGPDMFFGNDRIQLIENRL